MGLPTAIRQKQIWTNPWALFLIPFFILVMGVSLRIAQPFLVEAMMLRTFDFFQRLKPRQYVEAPVGGPTGGHDPGRYGISPVLRGPPR